MFFFLMIRRPPRSTRPHTLFPYTPLFRSRHVLTSPDATRRYRTGFRFGSGKTLAVVRPGTLLAQWQILDSCARAGVIVISQASNTGLTGGRSEGRRVGKECVGKCRFRRSPSLYK